MPARAIGLAVRYSELLVAEQLGNTTFGTARHITTTLRSVDTVHCASPRSYRGLTTSCRYEKISNFQRESHHLWFQTRQLVPLRQP